MDGGAWWAAVHGVVKSRTQLSDFTFTFHFHALEKEMATHSSVLAWRIPGTGWASWAAVSGVAQSRTRLKWLSSSSSSRWFSGKEFSCQCRRCRRLGFNPWVRKIPLEEQLTTEIQYFCLENPMDRGVWQGTVHGGHKRVSQDVTTKHAHRHHASLAITLSLCSTTQ